MGIHAGWESAVDLFWEYPLGTMGTTGFRYLSDQPDTLTIGAEAHERKVIGNRFIRKEHLRILRTNPGGALGPTPFWFSADNKQTSLNRILNSHFQNTVQACGIPPLPCYSRHYPVSTQPTNMGGFTIRRDIGLGVGSAYVWRSAIMSELAVDWRVGQPVTLTPTFATLEALPNDSVSGAVAATDPSYQRYYYMAPALDCEWNGTRFYPAGWRITSRNNVKSQWGPNSKHPIGYTLGVFEADLELDVWIDDDFYTRFVPKDNIGTSVTPTDTTGTFQCTVSGPIGTMEGGIEPSQFDTIFYFTGKIIDMPGANPNMSESPTQKVKMRMTATGTTYDTCGYYIECQENNNDWQTPDGL
jgi:hypothetical protein